MLAGQIEAGSKLTKIKLLRKLGAAVCRRRDYKLKRRARMVVVRRRCSGVFKVDFIPKGIC